MKKTLTVLISVLMAVMLIMSCDGSSANEPSGYKVSFDLNGGSGDIKTQTIAEGKTASEPETDPTPSNANYYVFDCWTAEGETTGFDFSKVITEDTKLVAKWKDKYEVGNTGPAGGKIFYVATTEQSSGWGSGTLTWKYLEAAPENLPITYAWGTPSSGFGSKGAGTGIGTGWSNNLTLSEDYFPAAAACRAYTNNGVSDWFLPSKDELLAMYENRNQIGNNFLAASTVIYWSSSEAINNTNDTSLAAVVSFNDGSCYDNSRGNKCNVRPIRAF